ncbi:MAG TPA: alpha-L-fucosidase [Verrucomicrobiae bacterium]|nr:alpha-L-fucosidase [Verrucomicrobiae bacterium]
MHPHLQRRWLPFALVGIQLLVWSNALEGAETISAAEEQQLQATYSAYDGVEPQYRHAGQAAIERWMDLKWGLRIHWGLYAMFDGRESWILRDHQKDKDWQRNYYASYRQFNPTNFDADEWMRIMQRAGLKYFSFTAKHHEGFCLWPTRTWQRGFRKTAEGTYEPVTDHYSIAETPYHKDIIGQLVKAGRAHGLGVSLYFSHIDWHDPDFAWDPLNFSYDPTFTKEADPKRWAAFIRKEREQITELLTWYGPIDTLCLDIAWPDAAQTDAYGVAEMARSLQPQIMLRNRGIGPYGDYETPEGEIPADPNVMKRPWQVIYPCGTGFSYKRHDTYKSKEWVLESLIDIVAKGGNFQVGFGPDPTGKWPQEMIDRVSYVGDWLKINHECIFATRPYFRYHEGKDLRFTRTKDKKVVYIIALKWPGEQLRTQLVRPRTGSTIHLLGVSAPLAWKQEAGELVIDLPAPLQTESNRPCRQAYAFKVESEDWPEAMNQSEPLHLSLRSLKQAQPGSDKWEVQQRRAEWDPTHTAVVICDMWDRHWCKGATARVAEMAPRMNELVTALRNRGVFIIHCPSDTMAFYEGSPARKLAQRAPKFDLHALAAAHPGLGPEHEPPLPIDDSDGGCDDSPQCPQSSPWTHESAAIQIAEGDAVAENAEPYGLMRQRGITNVLIMGVHENMCVLGRTFGIRQLVRSGLNVALVRDLTDTMYNSRRKPFVDHFTGTALVCSHIEKYWCPTITSEQIIGGSRFWFKADVHRM